MPLLTVVPGDPEGSIVLPPPSLPSAELLAENMRLRESLAALQTGLQAGHQQLAESLTNLLAASNSNDEETQRKLSERQVALYLSFLTRAVDIAGEAAQPPNAIAPPRKQRRRKSSLFREWLSKRVSRR